ncbi:hypothetical protein D918_08851 [Trichuris suis]|nr:hypothetical protein D918_08851 [Trichuris suis]
MMVEWSDSDKPVDDFEPAKQRGVASVAQNRCNANAANNHGDSSTFTVKVVEVAQRLRGDEKTCRTLKRYSV